MKHDFLMIAKDALPPHFLTDGLKPEPAPSKDGLPTNRQGKTDSDTTQYSIFRTER